MVRLTPSFPMLLWRMAAGPALRGRHGCGSWLRRLYTLDPQTLGILSVKMPYIYIYIYINSCFDWQQRLSAWLHNKLSFPHFYSPPYQIT